MKIKTILRRLFAPRIWAANDTIVGTHPDGIINCTASGAIVRNTLVKFTDGKVGACASGDLPVGIVQDTVADGEPVAVALLGNRSGTSVCVASEAVAQGDLLYALAAGKVGKTKPTTAGTYYTVGYALDAASAGGDVEIQHFVPRSVVVS